VLPVLFFHDFISWEMVYIKNTGPLSEVSGIPTGSRLDVG
jgi:hypothetical protein